MNIIEVVVLSLVQGFSEFLPISSSAHLVLVPKLLGWKDQGLAFDVSVHVGTLIAVILYFRHDLKEIFSDFYHSLQQKKQIGQSNIFYCVFIATLPAIIFGYFGNDLVENYLRSPLVIAATTIIFGILLYFADLKSNNLNLKNMSIYLALLIGISQAIAIIPGTSRSGITITMALFLGFSRQSSAKFSFLMSIPVILAAGGYKALGLIHESLNYPFWYLILGIFLSFLSAYICIYWFLDFIKKISMLPFVIYRLILGAFLLIVFI